MTATPPRVRCSGPQGQHVRVPLTGKRAQRVVHGARNIPTGSLLLFLTALGEQTTPQDFLPMIRSYGRGWRIVLCEERGPPPTAEERVA